MKCDTKQMAVVLGMLLCSAANAQQGTVDDVTVYGTYTFVIQRVGFEIARESLVIFEGNQNCNLGEISLAISSTAPQEIVVLGPQAVGAPTLESRIYNIDDNIAQSTGSLMDVMLLVWRVSSISFTRRIWTPDSVVRWGCCFPS